MGFNKKLVLCFLLLSLEVVGQQDPQFGQYMINPYIWNPSYPALKDQYMISFHHRTQWLGYTTTNNADQINAPSTQLFTATLPLKRLKSGAGVQILNDNIGPLRNFNLGITYAYAINVGDGRVGIGVGLGLNSLYINTDLWRAENPNDPILASANASSVNQMRPNFKLGMGYTTERFYLGATINNVLTPSFNFNSSTIESKLVRHYYVQSSYLIDLSENLKMQPSAIFKSISGANSFEVSNLFMVSRLWAGASFRSSDAVIGLIGISLFSDNSLKFGYNIDLSVINGSAKSLSSHEIYISYNIGSILDNRKPIVRSPRFRL